MKTYVLMISRVFPATHPRRGQKTRFREKIENAVYHSPVFSISNVNGQVAVKHEPEKIHTIRLNYDLWAKRAEKINAGEAVLSLRQWVGKPYASKQVEILRLEKISVQPLRIADCRLMVDRGKNKNIFAWVERNIPFNTLVKNDGLSFEDFCAWFGMDKGKKKFDMSGCVINFTDHKY